MGRWTPSITPAVPRYVPPVDIGTGLRALADGLSDGFDRRDRNARAQAEADRYYDAENNRRIERALDRQRQGEQDKIAAQDRQRRIESDYLTTTARARDEGYGDAGTMDARAGEYGAAGAGAGAIGGAAGMGGAAIYDALYDASTGGDELTLTTPSGATKRLRYDPTQTREVRDDQRAIARQRMLDAMKAPGEDPVARELREYRGKLDIDREYRINDFKPEKPSGGGSGGGSSRDSRLRDANTMFDNANQVVARVERQEPKRPTFDRFNGMDRPMENEPTYPAFKADSIAKETAYDQQYTGWQRKLNDATQRAQKWMSIGDAIASETVGARGGDSVFTQQQVNAQREIQQVQAELNKQLPLVQNDPIAMNELREAYAREVQAINAKYGIRPKPED